MLGWGEAVTFPLQSMRKGIAMVFVNVADAFQA
jgi:hypothetical protein